MSREIKFRVWDNVYYMSSPFTLYDIQNGIIQFAGDIVFMQFTGLQDKNGKDIYEGDRVKRRVHLVEGKDYIDYNFDVKWNGWTYCLFMADKQMGQIDPITARECEVIGNIYESPKLLNPSKPPEP